MCRLVGLLIGWLIFNGTFSTSGLYHAMSNQKINPRQIQTLVPLSKQVQ